MASTPNNNPEHVFKNPYQTDFMRVPQMEDPDGIVRHPGLPTSPQVKPRSSSQTTPTSPQQVYPALSTSTTTPGQEDVLVCPVCKIDYDSVLKRPILLPGCGHTFCSVCIRERSVPCLECPICRRSYPGASIDSLPINISLEALLVNRFGETTLQRIMQEQSSSGSGTSGSCAFHCIRLSFWCRSCEEVACGECLFDRHPTDGHTLAKLQDVADEIRNSAVSTITLCHDDAAAIFSNHLKNFVTLLGDLHEAGKLMQESRKLVAAAECAKDFSSVTSVFEAIKLINSRVVELKLESEDVEINVAVSNEAIEKGATSSSAHATLNKSTEKASCVNEASQVYAMHSDGRLSKIQTEEHGLHVYALSKFPSTGYSVAVRLGLLMEFIHRDKPLVFLDFSAGLTKLGRVYIQLKSGMRRSLQFLHLCLGTMGPSYHSSRVDGLCDRNCAGEYLRLGDYTGQGGQGGIGLIDGLEWGARWTDTKKTGQVCGVGGDAGEKRFGALFVLCTRDNPNDTFRAPFGTVIRGMETVRKITAMENVEAVHISDCGAVIPIN